MNPADELDAILARFGDGKRPLSEEEMSEVKAWADRHIFGNPNYVPFDPSLTKEVWRKIFDDLIAANARGLEVERAIALAKAQEAHRNELAEELYERLHLIIAAANAERRKRGLKEKPYEWFLTHGDNWYAE